MDHVWCGLDDGKASMRQKKIMDLYADENEDAKYFSFELKQKAGFGKEGEKGFEGVLTNLQMLMYLVLCDFRQRKNKKGEACGWPIASYSTPEHLWGREYVTSAYAESAVDSGKRIAMHLMGCIPLPQQIRSGRYLAALQARRRNEPGRRRTDEGTDRGTGKSPTSKVSSLCRGHVYNKLQIVRNKQYSFQKRKTRLSQRK